MRGDVKRYEERSSKFVRYTSATPDFLKIKTDKFNHLEQLKSIVVMDFHYFYDQLYQ